MPFLRQKCKLRTVLISFSGERISPKIIQSFSYMTLRAACALVSVGWLAMTSSYQKFSSPYLKHQFPNHAGKHTSAVTLTRNGCLYHKTKKTQYYGQHEQTDVIAVVCLQTNHSAKINTYVLDKEPTKSI